MLFRQIYDEGLAQAAYLIGCQKTGEAIVVDPARDVDRYVEMAQRHGLRIVAATETHIHADFLSGTRELAERVGARVYLSDEGDADWKYGWLYKRSDGGRYDHTMLKDDDTFRVGNIEFRATHTPGHTPEHMSFAVTDVGGGADRPMGTLTGDFVFVGDLGRPDLLETAAGYEGVKEASARALLRSSQRFLGMDDYLQVWPAHGAGSACGKALGAVPQSTVGYERQFNPALQLTNDGDAFVASILDGQPEPPLYFGRMKTQNRDGVPLLGVLTRPRELDVSELKDLDGRSTAIVDTRSWGAFRNGHIAGALFAPLGSHFHTVVGSYVEPETTIVLVAEPEDVESAVRELIRIGLDNVTAFIQPASLGISGIPLSTAREISVEELREAVQRDDTTILDVRRGAELSGGVVTEDAINVAHTRLPNHLDRIPKDRPILIHCATGGRSAFATAYLQRRGYDVTNVAGGYRAWKQTVDASNATQVRGSS